MSKSKPSILKRLSVAPPPAQPAEPHHLCERNIWRPTDDGSGWICAYCYPLNPPAPLALSAARQQFLLIGAAQGYPLLQVTSNWSVGAGEEGWRKFAQHSNEVFFAQALATAIGMVNAEPTVMRFSVSSWHFRKPEEWLAIGAFTIMATPPDWAREHARNLPLFAAPKSLVFGNATPEQYTHDFTAMLDQRTAAIERFIAAHQDQHVILLCACPGTSIDERFCHRYLVARCLTALGCQEVPLPERNREAA